MQRKRSSTTRLARLWQPRGDVRFTVGSSKRCRGCYGPFANIEIMGLNLACSQSTRAAWPNWLLVIGHANAKRTDLLQGFHTNTNSLAVGRWQGELRKNALAQTSANTPTLRTAQVTQYDVRCAKSTNLAFSSEKNGGSLRGRRSRIAHDLPPFSMSTCERIQVSALSAETAASSSVGSTGLGKKGASCKPAKSCCFE